jgi:hypothetical protein
MMFSGIYFAFFASAIQAKFAVQNIANAIIYENGELKPFEWDISRQRFPIIVYVKITDMNREFWQAHKPTIFDYYSKVGKQFINKSSLKFSSLTKSGSRTAYLGDDLYEGELFRIENPLSGILNVAPFSDNIKTQRVRKIELKLYYEAKSVIRRFYIFGIPIFLIGVFLFHKAHLREMARIAHTEESIEGRLWGRPRR